MLRFSQAQFDALRRATFVRLLESRIADEEGQDIRLSEPQATEMWQEAEGLANFGIRSIRGCLVVCHIIWEMGRAGLERIPAFQMVLNDPVATEPDKVDALWALRTQLLSSLEGN